MALPPNSTDSAPFTKHKKKKKKSGREENNKGGEDRTQGGEDRTQGGEDRTQERKDIKKRRHEQTKEGNKEREQEGKEVARKKKRKKANGTQPEESSQGDEMEVKKKKRKENETQTDQRSQGDKVKVKKEREENETLVDERTQEEEMNVKESETQTDQRSRGEEMSVKKRRKIKEEAGHPDDESHLEMELSSSDLLELEEFIPDIRKKSLEVRQMLKRYDLPRFREFKHKGLKLRWGKYSQAEKLQIQSNVQDFLKLTGIESPEELLFPQRFPEREAELKKLKVTHRFYQRLAEGLLRTCTQVYICARKMFDSRNHKGRFSEAEVVALKKLHAIHGNDWKIIGDKLERSIYACQKRYAAIVGVRGPWAEEELQRLKKAAQKHLKRLLKASHTSSSGPSFLQLCSRLPWAAIERKVRTRCWNQCRLKWFSYLRSRMKAADTRPLPQSSIETRIRLIRALNELQVDDVSDVDWIELAKAVGGLTPICAQKLYHRMKVSLIPSWTQCSFGETVDHLYDKELPHLLKKLKSAPGPGPGPAQFSLDQLFPPELDNS